MQFKFIHKYKFINIIVLLVFEIIMIFNIPPPLLPSVN